MAAKMPTVAPAESASFSSLSTPASYIAIFVYFRTRDTEYHMVTDKRWWQTWEYLMMLHGIKPHAPPCEDCCCDAWS